MGRRLALTGGNPYRARTYSRAAESLRSLIVPLDEVLATDRLRELPGVGEAMAGIIPVLHATGTHPMLEELRSDIPDSALGMLAVPGLKPEKVLALFRELGICSHEELEAAAKAGALGKSKRFGVALERKVLQGIEALRSAHGRMHLAEAAMARGYACLGVTDHSQSEHYAGGLKLPDIEAQHDAIDRLNGGYRGFRMLKGIESDIREDGSLDYPDEVLETFDFVIASVHGKFRLEERIQTERIIRAVSNPFTTILGHMTGRQLLRRPGYEVDVEAVLRACAEHGVAVEVNANPWRLHLDWRWHRRALDLGHRGQNSQARP